MTEGNKKRNKKKGKIIKKEVNKNEVEEPRFQMNKFKLEKDLSNSRRMRALINLEILFSESE